MGISDFFEVLDCAVAQRSEGLRPFRARAEQPPHHRAVTLDRRTLQVGVQAAQAAPAAAPSVMTVEEAAAYLKVSPADIQEMIDGGELKAKKVGSQVRISKDVIDAFMAG